MKYFSTLIFLLVFSTAFSQQIITDRPDQTESSSTISKGSLQIEMGLVAGSMENINSFAGPSTLLRYGIAEWIELRLFNQYESYKVENFDDTSKVSGFSDLEIGTKIQLFKKEGVNTEIAFLSHAIIPTAKDELTNDKMGVINKLSIAHELSERFGLGYNIGYDYVGQTHAFTYSVALGIGITDNFGAYIEPYGVYAEQGFYESNFDFGLTYLTSDNFQLDASYGFGTNNDMQYFSLGFSWNIPHLFGSKNI
ncbi:MAG: transporter [Urechidicola sp.]|nr:transporter [Urechidicola sp.]